jgi:hypothetical protein
MKLPAEIIELIERETEGLTHGEVTLKIILHDGHARYVLNREVSVVPGKPTSGAQGGREL